MQTNIVHRAFGPACLNFACAKVLHLVAMVLLFSCAALPKTSPEFEAATEVHEVVALLPVNVSLENAKLPKEVTTEMRKEMEETEQYRYQQTLYDHFSKKSVADRLSISIQPPSTTNELLRTSGALLDSVTYHSPGQLIEILGVDAVMIIDLDLNFVTSDAAGVVTILLTPFVVSSRSITLRWQIVTANPVEAEWSFTETVGASAFTTDGELEKFLMKRMVRRFPYRLW